MAVNPETILFRGIKFAGLLTLVLGSAVSRTAVATPRPGPQSSEAPADTIELVDRVVAVVGDTALLWSEVLETVVQMRAQGFDVPATGTPGFDSLVIRTSDDLVDQLILLQKAKETEITVPPEVLDGETDRRFREIRNSFPTATAFQDAVARSGRTLVQYRQMLRAQVRAQLMIDEFIQQNRENLPPVAVTEEEIRTFFDERLKGETRPANLTFEQIVVEPEASEAAADSALETARTALREIREGTDFAVVARTYSQDLSNRDQGGELGWVNRGQLVADFARAAWSARTGEPVGPVRTRFGFHIIQVENVRGGERKIRHILVQPTMTRADFERAQELAAALADSVRGGRSVGELAERYGIAEIPVRLPDVPVDEIETRLGAAYAAALGQPFPGQVVGPFVAEGLLQDRPVYVVLRILEFKPQGEYDLDDVREDIRSRLLFDKGYERFIEELKNEIYIERRL